MPVEPTIVKKAVRENFNMSSDLYEQFEQEYGLFNHLTVKLCESCSTRKGMKVADIGCGTGTSSYALQKIVGAEGAVIGIDSSEKMLEIARKKLKSAENPNVKFVLADAEEFVAHVDFELDAVLYNATIFLIPEPKKTLKVAYEALAEHGTVGMNYLMGLYGTNSPDDDLFQLVRQSKKEFAPYGRKVTDTRALPGMLKEIGFKKINEGIITREMAIDEMKAFYSIPAQSAGLWPRHKYEERLSLLDSLIEHYQEHGINAYNQLWGWCCAVK